MSTVKGGNIVRHIPYTSYIAPLISYFLVRGSNKGVVEVTGVRVNRGAGMSLEVVPCVYRQSHAYIDEIKGHLITSIEGVPSHIDHVGYIEPGHGSHFPGNLLSRSFACFHGHAFTDSAVIC